MGNDEDAMDFDDEKIGDDELNNPANQMPRPEFYINECVKISIRAPFEALKEGKVGDGMIVIQIAANQALMFAKSANYFDYTKGEFKEQVLAESARLKAENPSMPQSMLDTNLANFKLSLLLGVLFDKIPKSIEMEA